MKLILYTDDEKQAKLKLAQLHASDIRGFIKYDNYLKRYKVYQTNKIVPEVRSLPQWAQRQLNDCKEALEDMVFQFGYHSVKNKKPVIHTGGLSALEDAFETLGWDDPHYLPEEGYTCEVVGCMEADTAGTHWGDSKLYLRLCHEHYAQSYNSIPMPSIKQWALDREAKRDPITRVLPLKK